MSQTRRQFLHGAGAGVAALSVSPTSALARRRRRPTVAVLGGGIAGLTAAHELAERGFDVTIYERRAWGGKARSTSVPGTGTGGRRDLPGEHGYRIFFGVYENIVDSFRRIPFGGNPNGVFDNLVAAPQATMARPGGHHVTLPLGQLDPTAYTAEQLLDIAIAVGTELDWPPEALAHWARKMFVFMSSSDARRLGQWENTSWTDFMAADRFTDDYRDYLVSWIAEVVQASKADETSAAFCAWAIEFELLGLAGLGANGPMWRVMDRPTSEALFDPWMGVLRDLGVRMRNRHEVVGLQLRHGRIAGARVRRADGSLRAIQADHYVCALPVERARALWTSAIRRLDPGLARMDHLGTDWMNGLKLFLREQRPIVKGHVLCIESPWLISMISQSQFWAHDFAGTYGDGQVRESLSAIISDWHAPGALTGRPAKECTREEIVAEVWFQLKRHINEPGEESLTDDLLHSWDIDPGMVERGGRLVSEDPLVLPTTGHRALRPQPATAIPNLFLAGDYLDGDWQVANMEAASFGARRAVNALLERAGSREAPAKVVEPYRPPCFEPFKELDEQLYSQGRANLFDNELSLPQLRAVLRSAGR